MLHFHVHPKSACCSRVRRGLEACLHILLPILGFLWREAFSGFSFFKACSFQGWAFAWSWAFPPSAHSLALFYSLYVSCHTVLLFLLWCYLTEAYWASLGLLLILPSMTQYSHLGFLVTLLVGSYVQFFFWASLAHLLSFGLFGPFPNSAFPWAFTNSFGLPWPNYLIPHPWSSWTCHQPFAFFACITLGLLWLILTFLHHILPMGLPLLSLRAPLGPFTSSRPIFLFHGSAIHCSCCLGLVAFLSTH